MDNNKKSEDKKPKPIIHAVKGIMKRGFGHRPPCAGCSK